MPDTASETLSFAWSVAMSPVGILWLLLFIYVLVMVIVTLIKSLFS